MPSFWPALSFDMPSSLKVITPSFWFKVRGMWLFLSLEQLGATVGLLTGLISKLLCLREQGGPRRGRVMGSVWSGGQSEHTHIYQLCLLPYLSVVCGTPTWLQHEHQRSLITDHQSRCYNSKKVWNISRNDPMWHSNKKWANNGKWCQQTCSTFNL